MNLPFVVIEGAARAADAAVAELRALGWTIVAGWTRPVPARTRCVRIGQVATRADAEAALLAALGGVGLVVHGTGDRALTDRLVDDLRRLGPVDHRIVEPEAMPDLPPEVRALLGLLAEGHSEREAAAVLGLSSRAARRRLAAARRALGVARTHDAIVQARRIGWLRHPRF
jgi:hypothetical protein